MLCNIWWYLILIGDLLIGEVGDGHLIGGGLSDLVLRSFAGFPGVEEVTQRLVVYLNKARREIELRRAIKRECDTASGKFRARSFLCVTSCTYFPALCSQFLCCSEDLLHSPGNDTSGFANLLSFHGVGLSASRLAVRKATDIVPVQSRLHQERDLLKDL